MATRAESFNCFPTILVVQADGVPIWNKYWKGQENTAADALSRVIGAELLALTITAINTNLLDLIKSSYTQDQHLLQVLDQLQQGQVVGKYNLQDGLLQKKGKLVIGPDEELRSQILTWMHDSPTGGNSGREATLKRVQILFHWKGMTKSAVH